VLAHIPHYSHLFDIRAEKEAEIVSDWSLHHFPRRFILDSPEECCGRCTSCFRQDRIRLVRSHWLQTYTYYIDCVRGWQS